MTAVLGVQPFAHSVRVHNLTVEGLSTYYVVVGVVALLVHNSPVGACPVNGLPHGKLGEAAKTASGTGFRADFVARDPSGKWVAVEAKTGRGAEITPGQAEGYPALSTGRRDRRHASRICSPTLRSAATGVCPSPWRRDSLTWCPQPERRHRSRTRNRDRPRLAAGGGASGTDDRPRNRSRRPLSPTLVVDITSTTISVMWKSVRWARMA